MNRDDTINRLVDHLAGVRSHPLGVAGFMIEDEIAAGRRVIQPGSEQPFAVPADDWVFPAVISYDAREAFIVAVLAVKPRSGALRRLVAAIIASDRVPVIVCPVGPTMPAILHRWGWTETTRGDDFNAVEEWRPPKTRTQGGYDGARDAPRRQAPGAQLNLQTPSDGSETTKTGSTI